MINTNPLDLAKNNSNQLELEDMFEEYAEVKKDFEDCDCQTMESEKACDNCICEAKRMQEIISEVTKQIQSDLLKEIMKLPFTQRLNRDNTLEEPKISEVDILKLAEEKGIEL